MNDAHQAWAGDIFRHPAAMLVSCTMAAHHDAVKSDYRRQSISSIAICRHAEIAHLHHHRDIGGARTIIGHGFARNGAFPRSDATSRRRPLSTSSEPVSTRDDGRRRAKPPVTTVSRCQLVVGTARNSYVFRAIFRCHRCQRARNGYGPSALPAPYRRAAAYMASSGPAPRAAEAFFVNEVAYLEAKPVYRATSK